MECTKKETDEKRKSQDENKKEVRNFPNNFDGDADFKESNKKNMKCSVGKGTETFKSNLTLSISEMVRNIWFILMYTLAIILIVVYIKD